jgi:hypothetical protein
MMLHFDSMPICLETYQVGVIEGVLTHCKLRGAVRVSMESLDHATIEIAWR